MKKRLITIAIIIVVLLAIIYFAHKITLGDDGLLTKASNVEIEYNKNEIITVLKKQISEKYLEAYNLTKEDSSKKIEDSYNVDVALNYLKEKGFIEYYYYSQFNEENKEYKYEKENITEDTSFRKDIYFINVKNALKDIEQYGKGEKYIDEEINKKDVFLLEASNSEENIFILNYYNVEGQKQEIGKLNFKEPI